MLEDLTDDQRRAIRCPLWCELPRDHIDHDDGDTITRTHIKVIPSVRWQDRHGGAHRTTVTASQELRWHRRTGVVEVLAGQYVVRDPPPSDLADLTVAVRRVEREAVELIQGSARVPGKVQLPPSMRDMR